MDLGTLISASRTGNLASELGRQQPDLPLKCLITTEYGLNAIVVVAAVCVLVPAVIVVWLLSDAFGLVQ